MNAIDQTAEPKLAEPGAGLPLMEWFVAKHVIIPLRFHFTTVAQGIEQFEHESNQILAIAKSLSEQNLCQRRLVPRLRGLEDSSRYWSVAMAIEHLVIVGNGMSNIITSLSKEISELPVSKIENVKPSLQVNASQVIERFETMSDKFIATMKSLDFSNDTKAKHAHPWFGPLNAREWLLFAAPHQRIHRCQIEEIVKRL